MSESTLNSYYFINNDNFRNFRFRKIHPPRKDHLSKLIHTTFL